MSEPKHIGTIIGEILDDYMQKTFASDVNMMTSVTNQMSVTNEGELTEEVKVEIKIFPKYEVKEIRINIQSKSNQDEL